MGKYNLSDAAKAILTEGAKESFDANLSSKRSGQDGATKLPTSVAYGMKDVGQVADVVDKQDDVKPDYTKGTPTATPPGPTPPIGSEPGSKLSGPADSEGSEHKAVQAAATDYSAIRDRIKARLATQTMQSNPGATAPYVPEEVTESDPVISEEEHEDKKEDKALIMKMMKKQKMKEEMDSDVNALLSGENLSEEFKQKATTIFEAAVIARSQSVVEEVEQAMYEEFEVAVEEIKEDLAVKLDDYISYMAEEWFKENQLAIEKGLRSEIVEDFIRGLKGLFEEHYIDIPEEKVDVVEQLTNRVEELEDSLNEQIKTAVAMKKTISEHKKNEAIHAVCEGLTQTQVEKFKSLAEGVDFTTEEEFGSKMDTLVESYFQSTVKSADKSVLNEEVLVEDEAKPARNVDPTIAQYIKFTNNRNSQGEY